jgi:hypothetical protein
MRRRPGPRDGDAMTTHPEQPQPLAPPPVLGTLPPPLRGSRRLRRTAGTAAMTVLLLGAGGTVALAAPAPVEPTCVAVLARANHWPGTITGHGGIVHLYSDGYARYLERGPACTAATGR